MYIRVINLQLGVFFLLFSSSKGYTEALEGIPLLLYETPLLG